MRTRALSILIGAACGMAVVAASGAGPTSRLELGKQEYQAKCVECHGESGRGEGRRAESLPRMPPDLTSYASRSGGFPTQHAWLTIDGRSLDAASQRQRVMPVWGKEFRSEAMAVSNSTAPESYVNEHIAALVDYVATLQVK